ncbi:MAG: DoxX family protein [Rickettsiales bacterium]|jgi:putative oxidoreductase|nr:DoxX family protein [Rickettsiales bacterium]
MKIIQFLISWPERVASNFLWAGPLIARITVGYVFMLSGWAKLQNLDRVTDFFSSLGIPFPEIMTPLVSGIEFTGGLFLIVGILTRISSGALAVTMIVAIISAKWEEVDSLHTLLAFEETLFLAIFTWLAICGAGKASLDYLISPQLRKI